MVLYVAGCCLMVQFGAKSHPNLLIFVAHFYFFSWATNLKQKYVIKG